MSIIDITCLIIGGAITLGGFAGMLSHDPYDDEVKR